MIHGKQRQFEACRNSQLVEDVAEVMFHRIFADLEVFGDFLVGKAGHDGGNDFEFAGGEPEFTLARLVMGRLHQGAQILHQVGDTLASYPILSGHDGLDGFQQELRGGVFQDDSPGAQLQRFDDLGFFRGGGQ